MKKILSILLFFCIILSANAENNHVIKAKLYGIKVLPYYSFKEIDGLNPSGGVELSYEYLPLGKYDWEKHWMFPRIGLSLLGTDLGKREFGQMVALYPYLNWVLAHSSKVEFGVKLGMGASFFSKHNQTNGAYAGVFFATGLNLQFTINSKSAITLEVGSNHTNNGEIFLPNYTMNMIYASFGYKHNLGKDLYRHPNRNKKAKDLPYKYMINNTLSAGARNNPKTQSVIGKYNYHGDILWKITNCYALGPGLDFGYSPGDIKLGLTLSNAFTMGNLTGIVDGGFYLYDSEAINAGYTDFLYYKFDNNKADGKLFLRAGLRYNIVKNFYAQATIKTHIYKFDYIEFGLGYSIKVEPSRKKSRHLCKCAKQYRYWQSQR